MEKTKKILKKVRRIEIKTNRLLNDVLAGEYKSAFRGRGMEFAEVREYQYGDQIRDIDWNVTARTGHPYVKVFTEEREMTLMLLVDLSSSGEFGTFNYFKSDMAAEISALLAFSAIRNNDKVGLIIFTDKIEKYIPPKKERTHVLRVIREILYFRPEKRETNINLALEFFYKVEKKKSVAFLISDFMGGDFEKIIKIVNKRHDLIAISITDPREREIPAIGLMEFEDSETGETVIIDTGQPDFRTNLTENARKERNRLMRLFRSINVDHISLSTDRDYIKPVIRFFLRRAKRFR